MESFVQIVQHQYLLDGMLPSLNGFLTEIDSADGIIRVISGESAPECRSAHTYTHDELLVHALTDGRWLYESPERLAPAQMLADAEHRELTLYLPEWSDKAAQELKAMHMLRTAMECRFCRDGILSLHAAAVAVDNSAIAFTGHSCVGKSTRAATWAEAFGAEWISGDRPALRVGMPATLFGVPWDGKEQIFKNVSFPLHAILDVRRSDKTYLRRLTTTQVRKLLLRQCFIPMWNTAAAAQTIATIGRAAETLPVYRLYCGPTADAAREAYDILFRHPENILEAEKDMKIQKGFVLRNVVGESIVMPTGENIAKFEGAVVLNEVSAFIFEALGESLSRKDLLEKLLNEFDVDEATASADLDEVIASFTEMGLLDVEA